MRVSINWLREFVDFDWSPERLAEELEMTGTAVEGIEKISSLLKHVVCGEITKIRPHPQADNLVVCEVDVGKSERLSIVCGAKNISTGDRVPVALVSASLLGGRRIGKVVFRGVESQGMLCSEKELGLGEDASGILILDTKAPIGKDINDIFELDDTVVDFEITPNRADCMSMLGIAREVAAITKGRVRFPKGEVAEVETETSSKASVEIKDTKLCPRYSARVIKDLSVGSSPIWLQQRLIKAGVRPINNLVDITNYIMMETGQPLHAFDYKRLGEGKIIVRRATEGEGLTTLDGVERRLTEEMLVIADPTGPVALAGVMGGAATEIGDVTTEVLLESAYFSPRIIYHASHKLDLRSESSSRFERGIDPNGTVSAANRAARLMAELAGGKVLKGVIDVYPDPIKPWTISLRPQRVNQTLGIEMKAQDMIGILERLELRTQTAKQSQKKASLRTPNAAQTGRRPPELSTIEVTVPTVRPDVEREIDLIEEVARIYGYNRIASTLPESSGKHGGLTFEQQISGLIRQTLVSAGLQEVINYTFISPQDLEKVRLPASSPLRQAVRIKNPLSEDQSILRTTLIPGLLRTISFNAGYGIEGVQIFEIGRVFHPREGEFPDEKTMVASAITGPWQPKQWYEKAWDVEFFDLKGIVEVLLSELEIRNWELKKSDFSMFHPGRSAGIIIDGESVGLMGEIHPRVIEAHGLSKGVMAFELEEEKLVKHATLERMAVTPSRYPAISLDIAFTVDSKITAEEVEEIIRKSGGPLLQSVHLFDVYQGEPIPSGYKSFAYRLVYQSPDRTLREEEAAGNKKRVIKSLEEELGAVIRT
ncbi:MAG: phenylalanine--tRNA ligase subunit beta [Actinomycetota bacterium]